MRKLLVVLCLMLAVKVNVYVKVGNYACLAAQTFVCWDDRVTQG